MQNLSSTSHRDETKVIETKIFGLLYTHFRNCKILIKHQVSPIEHTLSISKSVSSKCMWTELLDQSSGVLVLDTSQKSRQVFTNKEFIKWIVDYFVLAS